MKNILVLFGGCSTEHPVSLESAYAILQAMDRSRYLPLPVGITRQGRWLRYLGPISHLQSGDWQDQPGCIPCSLSLHRGDLRLLWLDGSGKDEIYNSVFPVLHGKNGEDGTIQGLLELIDAPIIGCGTLSSALSMDKDRTHKLVALSGIRTPQSRIFGSGASMAQIVQAAEELGYPLFVKPVRAGSSFGVSKVQDHLQLPKAVDSAFSQDREILLEEAIPGFEVGCALMGGSELTVGAVDEIELKNGFFDYSEKYNLITSRIHCPARISQEKTREIREAAKKIYRVLDCRGFARVDMFLTPDGQIVFNEVNTIPGFTAHSRFPGMMAQAGWDFASLVNHLIEAGAEQ